MLLFVNTPKYPWSTLSEMVTMVAIPSKTALVDVSAPITSLTVPIDVESEVITNLNPPVVLEPVPEASVP